MKNNISQTDALQTVFLLCILKIDLAKPHFKNQMNVLDIHDTVLKNEKHAKTARIRALGSNFCLNLGHFMHTSFFTSTDAEATFLQLFFSSHQQLIRNAHKC
jgi:hypothetical protein